VNTIDQSPNSPTLIDFDQLESACDGDVALKRELMEMYFTQAGQIMEGLRTAIQERSISKVDHLSHKLAGSSLACGMSAIVPAVRQMEHNAKAGHLDGADGYFAEAGIKLELLRATMEEHLRQQE
jgi:HPt (histidine-containing phosphotransfer) domain-containing protein